MSEQYWVGDFFIDLSRNQITKNNQSETLAPKALAVLTHLAENRDKVVSHDELLAKVWQGTVVSTNTLQRSIAQLRKALGDDGKVQVYIKTHAKQGYSLECDVRWHDSANSTNAESVNLNETQEAILDEICVDEIGVEGDDTNSDINHPAKLAPNAVENAAKTQTSSRSRLMSMAIIIGIIMLTFVGYQSLAPEQPPQLSFGELRALTATDNKESAGIYSPDGRYIVYHRYSEEFCINNLWAKDTKTQEEFRLTENLDTYGSHSFSEDGQKLAFVQSIDCSQPITQKKCYKLMSLDFNKALNSPQPLHELMECKYSKIQRPKWLNNDNIALLQKASDRWKLINYSVSEDESQVIYEINDGTIIYYDYSITDGLFALTTIHHDGHYYIEIVSTDGQLVSSHRINKPKEIPRFRHIYPNFSPFENLLVFSTGRQLFTLSYEGQISKVSLPLDEPIGSPVFHPNGDRMVVIKGRYDSDIVSVSLSQIANTLTATSQDKELTILERSTAGEDNAIFQPGGELIAYKSERSGEEQVWITDGEGSRQISHFPMDTYIFGMEWAADGQSLLVNANDMLTQIDLDSNHKTLPLEYPVVRLFQWDSQKHTALMHIRIKGILKSVELNLTNSAIRMINDKPVSWATKDDNGQLIYLDHMERFWRSGAVEDELIQALDDQGSGKRFVVEDGVIYGINDDFQLWSYALDADKFEIIGESPKNVDYLTDINQTQLLMTIRAFSKKEVAELYLSK